MTRLAFSTLFVLMASAAMAVDPTGKWAGRLIKGPDVRPNANPTLQRTEMNSFHADYGAVRYAMELKADHTFKRALKRGKISSVTTGTWSANGLAVTVVTTTISGAKITPQSAMFSLSADGKTLTYRQPNGLTLQYKRAT